MDFDLTGKMLISTPAMGDPRFERSLIYLCAHSTEGAFGLVVNRPVPNLRVREVLDQLSIDAAGLIEDRPVLLGGPVEPARGFVLHRADIEDAGPSQPLPGGLAMSASTEVLMAIGEGRGPSAWVLALGYAGWGGGQLEGELAQNAWLTCDGQEDLIFVDQPGEEQWHAALRSIGVDSRTLSAVSGRA
jgi:putative transcriptional regulator